MGPIKKIRYDCRQATFLIEKRQHKRLSWMERIRLAIHLSGCSLCRLFQQQSRVIERLMREHFHRSASRTHMLDEKFKQEMQEKINERLPK